MSRGFGAHADLVAQDNETVIYQYGGYNLNEPEFRNEKHLYDGLITIIEQAEIVFKKLSYQVPYETGYTKG